jgi:hypothetical protein
MSALALDDSRLLDTWDRAASLARPWRELALLESASGIPVDELARLTIGERDRLLLALRIGTFGNRLECETRCPSCDTRLELELDASQLIVPPKEIESSDLELVDDGWSVQFRLPDSFDVAASQGAPDTLAERCISVVREPPEAESDPSSLLLLRTTREPSYSMTHVRERVAERMAALDPQADVSLDLSCAACHHQWQAPFDPAVFLFREVDGHVARLTAEVHQLARAYGWSESSILRMGETRRRRYLSLLLQ